MDYYRLLNVKYDASYDEIRRNFKILAKRYYKKDDRKFNHIYKAYNTLKDPYKRGRYDERLKRDNNLFPSQLLFPKIPDIVRIPKGSSNSKYYSYHSSSKSHMDKDGSIKTDKKVTINDNGKKKTFKKRYITDKNNKVKKLEYK